MAKVKDQYERPPVVPIARYVDGTYRMPSIALNGGKPWYLYRVKDNDSWVSLATADGAANPWDLIEPNFGTRSPEEVNWYLREYLGCNLVTPDEHNYRFSLSAKPGLIWTRTPLATKHIENLPQVVLGALNFSKFDSNVFDFRIRLWSFEPWVFHRVRDYVRKGLIRVRHVPGATFDGKYVSPENTLYLKSLASSANNRSLMVHECVHAGLDFQGHKDAMKKAHSEALAYVAQCVYYQFADPGNELKGEPDEALIFQYANEAADEIIDKVGFRQANKLPHEKCTVSSSVAGNLLNAIDASKLYANSLHESTEHDGIPDEYGDHY
ncbi:MAG: hypothetical protein ABI822_14710 [Bryobacteraceae bacterium]